MGEDDDEVVTVAGLVVVLVNDVPAAAWVGFVLSDKRPSKNNSADVCLAEGSSAIMRCTCSLTCELDDAGTIMEGRDDVTLGDAAPPGVEVEDGWVADATALTDNEAKEAGGGEKDPHDDPEEEVGGVEGDGAYVIGEE